MNWIERPASRQELRRSGLYVGAALLLLALILKRYEVLGTLGAILIVLAGFAPAALRVPYRLWMTFGFALGWVVSRVVLAVLFALVVTPIALAARLLGKRFLDLRPDPGATTYWVPRGKDRPRYEKMY
jgi:hypothetical protein